METRPIIPLTFGAPGVVERSNRISQALIESLYGALHDAHEHVDTALVALFGVAAENIEQTKHDCAPKPIAITLCVLTDMEDNFRHELCSHAGLQREPSLCEAPHYDGPTLRTAEPEFQRFVVKDVALAQKCGYSGEAWVFPIRDLESLLIETDADVGKLRLALGVQEDTWPDCSTLSVVTESFAGVPHLAARQSGSNKYEDNVESGTTKSAAEEVFDASLPSFSPKNSFLENETMSIRPPFYRGDTRSPPKIMSQGFDSRAPFENGRYDVKMLEGYVRHPNNLRCVVSASTNKKVGVRFAKEQEYSSRQGEEKAWVYKIIPTTGNWVDVNGVCQAYGLNNPNNDECEVIALGSIPRELIVKAKNPFTRQMFKNPYANVVDPNPSDSDGEYDCSP